MRVLAHDTAGVGTARIEVSEKSTVPLLKGLAGFFQFIALGIDPVGDDILNHGLGAAVGVGGTNGAVLGNGNHVGDSSRIAIDSCRGREDNVADIVALHGAEESYAAADIDAVVLERNFTRFTNSLVETLESKCREQNSDTPSGPQSG